MVKKTDDDYDWTGSSLADAIRQASHVLGNERRPSVVIRWLAGQHGLHVKPPQASKVLRDLYQPGPADPEAIRTSLAMVAAVQHAAAKYGGIEKLKSRVDQAQDLFDLADTVGGIENLRIVVQQILDQTRK